MSVESMAVVLNHSSLAGTARMVLLGIANHMDDHGAWPKIETLARYAACSERTVQRCITQAVEAGELVVYRQDGGTHRTRNDLRPNRYVVLVECPAECDHTTNHRMPRQSDSPAESDGVTTVSPRYGNGNVNGVTPVVERGDTVVTPRTINEPSQKLLSTADAADESESGETSQKPTPGTRNTHKTGQTGPDALFEQFWTAWPGRKAQRLRAFAQFAEEVLAGTDPITIIQGTCRLAVDPNLPEQQMIPLPAKWLRDRGWEDDPYPPRAATAVQPATPTPPRFDRATHGNPAAAPPPPNLRALAGIA